MPRTAQVILRAWRREHLNLILCRVHRTSLLLPCCWKNRGDFQIDALVLVFYLFDFLLSKPMHGCQVDVWLWLEGALSPQ